MPDSLLQHHTLDNALFPILAWISLVNQTTPSAALDVLHHQHAKGGAGHCGRVFVTQRNASSWEMYT